MVSFPAMALSNSDPCWVLPFSLGSNHPVNADPQMKGLVPQVSCPHFKRQFQVGSQATHTSANRKIGGFHSLFSFDNLLEWLTELGRGLCLLLRVLYRTQNSWGRGAQGNGQKSPRTGPSAPWDWHEPPAQELPSPSPGQD